MAGERAATELQTDTTDDRVDAAGWAQLGSSAVAGVTIAVAIGFMIGTPFPWVTVVVLGVALAVVLPVSLLRHWWARGGRAAVLETRRWIRSGRVPDEVPDAAWRPRVRRTLDETTRQLVGAWGAAVVGCLWAYLASTGEPRDWVLVVLWASLAAFRFVQTHGTRVAARRLLDRPVRAVATV